MADDRTYANLRQETKRDLEQMFPGALLLTLKQAAQAYGYKDIKAAQSAIKAPRVEGERRVVYYLGDIASDIARRRCGNVGGAR